MADNDNKDSLEQSALSAFASLKNAVDSLPEKVANAVKETSQTKTTNENNDSGKKSSDQTQQQDNGQQNNGQQANNTRNEAPTFAQWWFGK